MDFIAKLKMLTQYTTGSKNGHSSLFIATGLIVCIASGISSGADNSSLTPSTTSMAVKTQVYKTTTTSQVISLDPRRTSISTPVPSTKAISSLSSSSPLSSFTSSSTKTYSSSASKTSTPGFDTPSSTSYRNRHTSGTTTSLSSTKMTTFISSSTSILTPIKQSTTTSTALPPLSSSLPLSSSSSSTSLPTSSAASKSSSPSTSENKTSTQSTKTSKTTRKTPASTTTATSTSSMTTTIPTRTTSTTTTTASTTSSTTSTSTPRTSTTASTPQQTPSASPTIPSPPTQNTPTLPTTPTTPSPPTPPTLPTTQTPPSPPTPPIPTTTMTTTPHPTPGPRFCNITKSNSYFTKCTNCFEMISCLDGDMQAQDSVETCTYRRRRRRRFGCQFRCMSVYTVANCCPGYWGDNCDACPGGSINPCNGHGTCSSETGRCVCEVGFKGTACEQCSNKNKYGPSCMEDCRCVFGQCSNGRQGDGSCRCPSGYRGRVCDQEIPGCKTLSCYINDQDNWTCAEVNGTATCVCAYGYKFDPGTNDCIGINPCDDPKTQCGENSGCTYLGPGQHKCICDDGYQGDGDVCIPIDPCQNNKGDCQENSFCVYLGPSKHKCKCLEGYENYQSSIGCTMTDVCTEKSCDVNAICETVEPLKSRCTCKEGYSGDGTVCHGNLLERIKQLNTYHPQLRTTLSYSLDILTRLYRKPLVDEGPFTIFLPNDRGFKGLLKNVDFASLLDDPDRAMQVMRQHMLIGKFALKDLQKYDQFYTLQGNPALLQIRLDRDVFKFKLHGTGAKAKVVVRDLPAYNGMIHVVNNLLTKKPEVKGNPEINAMDLIKNEVKYNRFQTLITAMKLEEMFSRTNITVFAPENGAWDKLPTGTLDYLMKDEDGKRKLKVILENHVFPGTYGVSSLVNYPHIKSLANVEVIINVTGEGQIRLDSKVNVTQVNIPCSNGFYHHVSGILVPSYIDELLPNICPQEVDQKVKGPCGFCYATRRCPLITDRISTMEPCVFWGKLRGRIRILRGCARICIRKVKKPHCCDGFYGPSCIPCPGGHKNPCNGRGKCADSFNGNGQCTCNSSYTGTACDKCTQKNVFGPSCNTTCNCMYGNCDEGPEGKGSCLWGSCKSGFVGENCNKKLIECGWDTTLCHAHSNCFKNVDGTSSCRCDLGYRGDGKDCDPINVCEETQNGGCDPQATCQYLGPGARKCSCNDGWFGDGFSCNPETLCSDKSDCHANASCHNMEPGKYICVCLKGFKGNGKECVLSNPCLVDNGGCDPSAICTPLLRGGRNCSCPEDTAGDGLKCYRTIFQQVQLNPQLTSVAKMLKSVSTQNQILDNINDKVTFFAPTDQAMADLLADADAMKGSSYFKDDFNVDAFVSFHTLYLDYSTEDFTLMEDIHQKYQTLYDGFSIHIANVNEKLHIFVNHSDFATFVQPDILAINGYIHVIDKVLQPFFPDVDTPGFEKSLADRGQFQLFAKACTDKNIFTFVDDLDEYTVFVPTDRAMENLTQRLTADFLKYYIVPNSYIFTPSVTDGMTAATALGPSHRLVLTISNDQIQVNGVPIIKSDILIDGGVMHIIGGLLHPVLHRCDRHSNLVNMSDCGPCNQQELLKCPDGFLGFDPPKVLRYKCFFNTGDLPFSADIWGHGGGRDSVGCQQICHQNSTVEACCSGYYGTECVECPGGPEESCGPHGSCMDGLLGDGTCQCDDGFAGPICDRCLKADTTGPYCNISYDSCNFKNGNCSENASCQMGASGVSCRCQRGYVGDGYSCTSVCATLYNGGCHDKAQCFVEAQSGEESADSFHCVCNKGYYGNGTWCSRIVNLCEINNGGCDMDRAFCHFEAPDVTNMNPGLVTCDCQEGFVGNGKTCNKDMMDAVSRMKELSFFYEYLEQTDQNGSMPIIPLMMNNTQKLTLFAPVSKDWNNLDLSGLLVSNQLTILSADQIKGGGWNFTSIGGQPIAVTVGKDNQLLANGVKIVKGNIETMNGIIHLTQRPIIHYDQVKVQATKSPSASPSLTIILIICAVVSAVVILTIIGVVLLVRTARATGSFNVLKYFRSGSESMLSFARLQAQDEDSDSFPSTDSAKYENPLFEDPDIN